MDTRIRWMALVMAACFALLFLQLNNLQVRQAAGLQARSQSLPQDNVTPNELYLPRGDIVSADGVVLAKSVPSNDIYAEQRVYPEGSLFAGITGYFDIVDDSIQYGVEATYNSDLVEHQSTANNIRQLLTQQNGTDTLTLTLSVKLQAAARAALAGRQGAVVAIQPSTGAILAMYANPTYDPNLLAGHDPTAVHKAATALQDAANPSASPLINGATQVTYAPGSTFKVVTTSAIYDHDPTLATTYFPYKTSLTLPETTAPLHNFANESCGGTLANALAVSCDTAYGQIGLDLGAVNLATEAEAFGFNKTPPLDLPGVAAAQFPAPTTLAPPQVADSAIGQYNVRETALQDALITAGIANAGVIMAPHVLNHVVGPQGQIIQSYKPHTWLKATSQATAQAVRELMLGVAAHGTASGLFPAGLAVMAKTGTAEGATNACVDDWLISAAPAGSGQVPAVAVAVVVNGSQPGVVCDGTGAAVAGPINAQVLNAALALGL